MKKKLPPCLRSCLNFLEANFARNTFLLFSTFAISLSALAQGPGHPNVDAGADVELACDETCTELTADYLYTGDTNDYAVSSIPYAPPFPFTGGTAIDVTDPFNVDDKWSTRIPLPFDFCFYGQTYTNMIVSTNGVVSFDSQYTPGTSSAWSFDESIPDPNLFKTAIFGVYMDIYPSPADIANAKMNWTVFGEAPNRTMVVSFANIKYFGGSCSSSFLTSQIVMYETTNVIEIYIEDRPGGCSWNDGNAVVGIQNQTGSMGETAPGRNTGDWSATNEAWRFTPNGAPNVDFSWLDADGNEIGTDDTINVCPTEDVTVYTAQAIYTNCNGDVITVTDDVTVTKTATFSVDLGGDQELCDASSYNITAELSGANPADATFLWSTGQTTQTITVNASGTYSVEVTVDDCTLTRQVVINFNELPLIDLGVDIDTCFETPIILDASPSNYDASIPTYEWSLDGVVITGETNATLNVTDHGLYEVTVSVSDCSSTDNILIAPQDLTVSLGDDIATCFEVPVILTAEATDFDPTLATYEWTLDGVLIADETSQTLAITESGTYAVVVYVGSCIATDMVVVSGRDDLEVTVDADFQTCPNELNTLTAVSSEEGVTFQWFLNGSAIAGATNSTLDVTIEAGTMGTQTYSVEITSGACTGEDSVDITLYPIGNCVISQGISPNGDGFNDTLDLTFLNDRTGIKSLQIFNRYGTKVFEQNNYTNQWKGQADNGNDLPTGTYFYVIDLAGNDGVYGQQTTGWIYLNQKAN